MFKLRLGCFMYLLLFAIALGMGLAVGLLYHPIAIVVGIVCSLWVFVSILLASKGLSEVQHG